MSTAKQTPLGVNALSALLQNTGLNINSGVSTYVGTSHTNAAYTPGTIVTSTVLNSLVNAINLAYSKLPTTVTPTVYNNLISIGSSTIPALGDSKPSTYTFTGNINNGDPDRNDPTPGVSWYPYDNTNAVTQWGFVRVYALQAWNEFNWNGSSSASSVVYKDFISSFTNCDNFLSYTNKTINTLNNAPTFLQGTYSNMDDLMTSDVSGVSLASQVFGQDLIATGKVIDLNKLDGFGLPSVLLKTIKRYNATTQSLNLALLASGLQVSDINSIFSGTTPTKLQEQQIYSAFLLIVGYDLASIIVPLNCKTQGLTSLTDLLNPIKLFPNSYKTLTVPVYNATPGPTNSKTYYPIYNDSGVNTTITFGSYLEGILPPDIASACGAFGVSMRQIKKIQNVPIEKFAQVVANLETTKNLTLVGGTNVPVDTTSAQAAAALVALGSGPNGTYTISDFFGCMSGLPYAWKDIQTLILQLQTSTLVTAYANIYTEVNKVTPNLVTLQGYIDAANAEILAIKTANPINAGILNTLYNNIGTQLSIEQTARNTALTPVPYPGRDVNLSQFPNTLVSFVDVIPSYATDTLPHMAAQTLEAISDWNTLGGQSIVGLMRQSRNKTRLSAAGIPLDDVISDALPAAITDALAANGTAPTTGSGVTNPCGTKYTIPSVPNLSSLPNPLGYLAAYNTYRVSSQRISTTSLGQLTDTNCPTMPQAGPVVVLGSGSPLDTGQAVEPGSFAGSPYQDLVPPNLDTAFTSKVLSPSVLSVPEAIDQVVTCNCDCWVS